jgi:hypothetical protein
MRSMGRHCDRCGGRGSTQQVALAGRDLIGGSERNMTKAVFCGDRIIVSPQVPPGGGTYFCNTGCFPPAVRSRVSQYSGQAVRLQNGGECLE